MLNIERNVAFISDKNQVYYALTNALMIERQSTKEVNVNLILVDIDQETKDDIKNIMTKNNMTRTNPIYLDSKNLELGVSKIEHITNTTNVRLYIASILKNIDNVLYLDNDVVVDGDISELFEWLDPEYSYGRPWPRKDGWVVILKLRGLLKNKWYVNAGVLYLNLKKMREDNIEEKLLRFQEEKKKKIIFADQDVLNCNINFEPLPYTWNLARDSWLKTKSDIASKSSLKIYHFLSKEKQWDESFEGAKKSKTKGSLKLKEIKKMIEPQKKWKKYYNELKNN